MLPIWLLAALMIMMYYWRFWEPCANAMLVVLLPKLWKSWLAQLFLDVFLGLTLAGPKKASKRTILHNRLNKKKLLVDVANLATCCHDDYDVLLEVLGTLGKCYVSSPVAKTLEIMTGTTVFWMSYCGSPLLDPKKLQNEQFYIIDWIRKKTPGRCCQSGYLLPWWLWCTIGGFGNPEQMLCCQNSGLDWPSWLAQLFLDAFLGLTLTGFQKSFKINNFTK